MSTPVPDASADAVGVHVRDMHPAEREAVAALTRAAYAEHARTMTPTAWAALEAAVEAALAMDAPGLVRLVAVRVPSSSPDAVAADPVGADVLLGSVQLHAPATSAYGALTGEAPWPALRLLAVGGAARGQGVGERLVAECARRARLAGAHALGLHSSPNMTAARVLYARLGFVRAPAHDFFPPGGAPVEAFVLALAEHEAPEHETGDAARDRGA